MTVMQKSRAATTIAYASKNDMRPLSPLESNAEQTGLTSSLTT